MRRNIALTLSFEGSAYHGFQRQKNVPSVQQALEEAISYTTGEPCTLYGCSRTDAGVHARHYVCSFRTDNRIPADRLPFALNARLDGDIAVSAAADMPPYFHARHSCSGKEYVYRLLNTPFKDPFLKSRAWHVPNALDLEAMRAGAQQLLGRHDFSAFMAAGNSHKTTVRTVRDLRVTGEPGGEIAVTIYADAYLYNMVRIIVGTLIYCGTGKLLPQDVARILAERIRKHAGPTAPPEGLYLNRVEYDDPSRWRAPDGG